MQVSTTKQLAVAPYLSEMSSKLCTLFILWIQFCGNIQIGIYNNIVLHTISVNKGYQMFWNLRDLFYIRNENTLNIDSLKIERLTNTHSTKKIRRKVGYVTREF